MYFTQVHLTLDSLESTVAFLHKLPVRDLFETSEWGVAM